MGANEQDVVALDDLADNGMREVTAGDAKILLSRSGESIHAVGATCPHAGGPLVQGARNGDRIICPWHKATFCLRTGRLLEPPAIDSLPRYPVHIANGRILVGSEPLSEHAPVVPRGVDDRTFIIIGGGAAGAVAAQTLRNEAFAGKIVMLDQENRVPYDRTLLSKYHLSGERGGEKTPLQSQKFYLERDIERRTAEVTQVDPLQRRITCADGATLTYDKALIATGAVPKPVTMEGSALCNVFTLRSRADADAILAAAERSTRAVVLGASFISLEVAAALRERGLDVILVGKEKAPFEKILGEKVGGAFIALHEKHGVVLRLGTEIAAIEGRSAVERVRLKTGETIIADLVIVGFGVKPVSGFLETPNRRDDGGIDVDATLRVTDGLYAAGDVAAFPYKGSRIRVEHWRVAEQHGHTAALAMLGRDVAYTAVPVFWTIQYMKRLDYVGHAAEWDDVIVHGDLSKPEFLAYYVKDGLVVAAVGIERDQDTAALIELLAMQTWTADEIGDSPFAVLAKLDGSTSR